MPKLAARIFTWFQENLLASLIAPLIASLLTALWFLVADNVVKSVTDAGQRWLPQYSIFLSSTGQCPGGWSPMGKVLLELEEDAAATFRTNAKEIYEEVNTSDRKITGDAKDFDAVLIPVCMKGSSDE